MKRKLNIYVSHSNKVDYENELYKPLLQSTIGKNYNLILPHTEEYEKINTKQILINSDIFIAEVTFSGLGIGLELGRAECNNIPIICLLKKGERCNSSVKRNFAVIEYSDSIDMIEKLESFISEIITKLDNVEVENK